jgi:hypothetical protein
MTMSWNCPDCDRTFRHTNQWHSCIRVTVSDHLKNKPDFVKEILHKLIGTVTAFDGVVVDPVKTAIQFKCGATFLSVKVKKDCLLLEFQLCAEVDEFPIYRNVRVSRERVLHFAALEEPTEIDGPLVGWLREAYDLIANAT